jgi:potassium/hydrogen antiporter
VHIELPTAFPLTVGYPDGELIFDVVFFVVVLSVMVQGLTVGPLAARLGLGADPTIAASMAEVLPVDAPGVTVLEIEVGTSCAIVGQSLADAPPPHDARVAAVLRGTEVIIPTGSSTLEPGDRIVVFGADRPDLSAAVQTWISGAAQPRSARRG